jgi:hypothetical protein
MLAPTQVSSPLSPSLLASVHHHSWPAILSKSTDVHIIWGILSSHFFITVFPKVMSSHHMI